jgi:putative membrane protein
MSKIDLSKPTRQSLKGLVFIFIQTIRISIKMFWAFFAVVILQKDFFAHKAILPIALAVLFVLFVVHSILYYLNFYFYVSDDEFILKKGYLKKKVLAIPLERIQSVNTKQNLIQQVLDVVAFEIDTAGTAGKELKIHALEKPYANALHDLLSKEKTIDKEVQVEAGAEERKSTEKLILKLSPMDLLKIGISQNHLRAGLIIVAFGSQIFQQVQDMFREQADKYSSEFVNYMSSSSFGLIVFLIIFFLVVSILFSLFRTVLKYFDFRLLKKENVYRVEAGLLSKRNVVLPHNKIQELNWETGPLKKLFGIYHLVFKQAVSMQNRRMQVVDAPGCLPHHLHALQTDLFGADELSDTPKICTENYYFRPLWIFSGCIPVLLSAPFLYNQWMFWLGAILWLVVSAVYCYLLVRKSYFRINNKQIRVSQGAISHKWKQMELFKIQSVVFKQTFFQKRRGLASLQLMNASGDLTIPYITENTAKQLYDYILFHTETSTEKWM